MGSKTQLHPAVKAATGPVSKYEITGSFQSDCRKSLLLVCDEIVKVLEEIKPGKLHRQRVEALVCSEEARQFFRAAYENVTAIQVEMRRATSLANEVATLGGGYTPYSVALHRAKYFALLDGAKGRLPEVLYITDQINFSLVNAWLKDREFYAHGRTCLIRVISASSRENLMLTTGFQPKEISMKEMLLTTKVTVKART